MLTEGTKKFTYNAFNQLVKAEVPTINNKEQVKPVPLANIPTEKVASVEEATSIKVQVNKYDAEGLRYEVAENEKLVLYIHSNNEVVTELIKDYAPVRYIRGLGLIASDGEQAKTYYHYVADERGSITHITQDNNIQNKYVYEAFGNVLEQTEQVENKFKYTGEQYDSITNQYYLRARYYNPLIGRFIQQDTHHNDGLNLYAYVDNNPMFYIDPSGHCKEPVDRGRDVDDERQALFAADRFGNEAVTLQDLLKEYKKIDGTKVSGNNIEDMRLHQDPAERFVYGGKLKLKDVKSEIYAAATNINQSVFANDLDKYLKKNPNKKVAIISGMHGTREGELELEQMNVNGHSFFEEDTTRWGSLKNVDVYDLADIQNSPEELRKIIDTYDISIMGWCFSERSNLLMEALGVDYENWEG